MSRLAPYHVTDLLRSLTDGARSGRWTPKRKAAALQLLDDGVVTSAQLSEKYGIDPPEVQEWRARAKRFGVLGLAARKLQVLGR